MDGGYSLPVMVAFVINLVIGRIRPLIMSPTKGYRRGAALRSSVWFSHHSKFRVRIRCRAAI